ncbi:MAG: hypothetical protein OHK0046_41900 [Anaerolineae bacterium]
MPQYLAPGVYIEETSYRSKSIEGVSTSTAGFIGPTRFGPVRGHPELLTSFADFERYYGGLEDLNFNGQAAVNYLALGVRAFFEEGGQRCYVMRVFSPAANYTGFAETPIETPIDEDAVLTQPNVPHFQARFPGVAGNIRLRLTYRFKDNVLMGTGENRRLARVQEGDVVFAGGNFFLVRGEGTNENPWQLENAAGELSALPAAGPVRPVTILVDVAYPTISTSGFSEYVTLGEYNPNPVSPAAFLRTFVEQPRKRLEQLTIPFRLVLRTPGVDGNDNPVVNYTDVDEHNTNGLQLINYFTPAPPPPGESSSNEVWELNGGSDGVFPDSAAFTGRDQTMVGQTVIEATGLVALEAVPDISILAAPGYTSIENEGEMLAIHRALITHCEEMRYRVAVLDTPPDELVTTALAFRNLTSSTHAALYYPWVFVADPRPQRPGQPRERLLLPPSGFMAGIYARNDVENAVFKAPANEVVRLAIDFELRLSKAQQEVLNPNGVNCLRFFEGRGFLVWGARTISDDPEWKYVSVRRYFAYLEYSIERGTQWAVFENNGPTLWANVRRTIEDFLYNEWVSGGLLGDKPEKAYFVRCDRSTMTQNDLDNGRLICLIGVAPVKPAEFVIFRIGQWTADS